MTPTVVARTAEDVVLATDRITKTFPGVVANYEITIDLRRGEIHALLGENGAGKTTLMAVIYGLQQPDSGRILLEGEPVRLDSPRDALSLGIGFVQQHFSLVPTLTVAENLVLSLRGSGERISVRDGAARVAELSERFGIQVSPEAVVSTLSVGMQQRAELLKALARDTRVLILDEPTSVLTPQEAEDLAIVMRRLAAHGVSIFLISHKLNEVLQIADRVTVLRHGRHVGTVDAADATQNSLAEMMVGRRIVPPQTDAPARRSQAETVLRATGLTVTDVESGRELRDVDLELRAGEILGIAGVEGSGQPELIEALAGARRLAGGRIEVGGEDVTGLSAREMQRRGVAHIAADRHAAGFVPTLTVGENLILPVTELPRFSRLGALRRRVIADHVVGLIEEYDIRVPGPNVLAATLSGGNQQRMVLARELSRSPRVVLSCFATRGLDFASTEAVQRRMLAMRDEGAAIAYASVDLDELFMLTDRILVLHEGRVAGLVDTRDAKREEIGLLMGGAG